MWEPRCKGLQKTEQCVYFILEAIGIHWNLLSQRKGKVRSELKENDFGSQVEDAKECVEEVRGRVTY